MHPFAIATSSDNSGISQIGEMQWFERAWREGRDSCVERETKFLYRGRSGPHDRAIGSGLVPSGPESVAVVIFKAARMEATDYAIR